MKIKNEILTERDLKSFVPFILSPLFDEKQKEEFFRFFILLEKQQSTLRAVSFTPYRICIATFTIEEDGEDFEVAIPTELFMKLKKINDVEVFHEKLNEVIETSLEIEKLKTEKTEIPDWKEIYNSVIKKLEGNDSNCRYVSFIPERYNREHFSKKIELLESFVKKMNKFGIDLIISSEPEESEKITMEVRDDYEDVVLKICSQIFIVKGSDDNIINEYLNIIRDKPIKVDALRFCNAIKYFENPAIYTMLYSWEKSPAEFYITDGLYDYDKETIFLGRTY